MAVSPDTSAAFQREVDEELRRDQMASAWRRYGVLIVAAVVLVLAVFGGVLWWQHHRDEVAGEQGVQLQAAYDALAAGSLAKTAAPLATLTQSKSDGYRAMALFTQADIALQKQDLKTAAARFAQVAGDTSMPRPFRDLALIRQTSAEFDTLKPEVVIDRLKPLAVKGGPWLGSAGELVAIGYMRMNRPDLAGALFGEIGQDDDVPASLKQRAVQMAGVLGVDAVAKNEGGSTK